MGVSLYNRAITFFCLVGVGLSLYAYYVELKVSQDKSYKAMCDISEHMSCSKVFSSPYGTGGGFVEKFLGKHSIFNKPNGLIGIIVYSLMALLAQSRSLFVTRVSLVMVVVANLFSVYLAYILYFILYDFCVVCVSTYVCSFASLLLHYYKIKAIKQTKKSKSKVQ